MNYKYLTERQARVVHAFYSALKPEENAAAPAAGKAREIEAQIKPFWFDRGHRARLRRAASLSELEAESACFALRERIGPMNRLQHSWLEKHDAEWLFLLAGAVAHVEDDTHDDRGLALALGKSSAKNDANPLSEMRFRRLLREEEQEAFYRQLRRALEVAPGRINVARLADDLLAWCAERYLPRQPPGSVRYRWARDYFLDRKEQKIAAQNSAV